MGTTPSHSIIKAATLNYSGINYSPFEFYSTDEKETKILRCLDGIFHKLVKMELKFEEIFNLIERFGWKIGNIDKYMQKERYSPIYNPRVGVTSQGLMSREQFQKHWNVVFDEHVEAVYKERQKDLSSNKKIDQRPDQEQKKTCRTLDFLFFKTFVEYIYQQYSNEPQQKKEPTLMDRKKDPKMCQLYQTFMTQFFNKSYLRDEYKTLHILPIMLENDVVFLQDLSKEGYQLLKDNFHKFFYIEYNWTSNCAISIKKNLTTDFKVISYEQGVKKYNLMNIEEIKPDQFNYYSHQPSVVLFAEKQGYIIMLISLHLSSGVRKGDQLKDFMYHIVKVKQQFKTKSQSIKIIIGGDFNEFIGENKDKDQQLENILHKFTDNFNFYPHNKSTNTTFKMRTAIHAQMNKTFKEDKKCRDFIVTHLKFKSGQVTTSQGEPSLSPHLLPDKNNPFDHFVVSTVIELN